jgi:hypothetical protein
MHGAKAGAPVKTGMYTKKAKTHHAYVMALIKKSKALTRSVEGVNNFV